MSELKFERLTKGTVIVSQGQGEKKDLYFVVQGQLDVFLPNADNKTDEQFLYSVTRCAGVC